MKERGEGREGGTGKRKKAAAERGKLVREKRERNERRTFM